MKKKSGIFSFRVNDILTSKLSPLHPFLTLPNDDLKRERGIFLSLSSDLTKGTKVPFLQLEAMLSKARKSTFFAVGSDVVKRAKKVPF